MRRLERFAVSAVQLSVESKNLQLDRQKLIRLEEEKKTRTIINIFNVQRLNVVLCCTTTLMTSTYCLYEANFLRTFADDNCPWHLLQRERPGRRSCAPIPTDYWVQSAAPSGATHIYMKAALLSSWCSAYYYCPPWRSIPGPCCSNSPPPDKRWWKLDRIINKQACPSNGDRPHDTTTNIRELK